MVHGDPDNPGKAVHSISVPESLLHQKSINNLMSQKKTQNSLNQCTQK